jgi:hypothetical protein
MLAAPAALDDPECTEAEGGIAVRKLVLAAIAATLFAVPPAQAAPPPHLLFDLAGTGTVAFSGDGGPASLAELAHPSGVGIASDGGVAVADTFNHRIRFIGRDGFIFTRVGAGTAGFSGDGGAAIAAQLNGPYGVAASQDGGWLIADTENHRVRKVSADGRIATVAGTGAQGFGGDGGPATAARLDSPSAVSPTPDGGFLIADTFNFRVRRVSPDGTITTVAGSGLPAYFGDGGPATAAGLSLAGVAAQADGGFVIADVYNARVRQVSPNGRISTIAGTGTRGSLGDGGPASDAQVDVPYGVAVAPDGSVLVADPSADRVRWIDPAGMIHTLAGTGTEGYDGDARDARTVRLNDPQGVAVGPSGEVAVAEFNGNRVRLIQAGLVPGPSPSPAQPATPTGTGIQRPRRLLAALGQRRVQVSRRARARIAYLLTDDARVTLELRRRGRRVARTRQVGRAGRNQITLPRLRKPGRYQVRLTATAGDGRISVDRGRLTVVR